MSTVPKIDLGASSSARWSTCTASPRFILENADKLPKDESPFADEGSAAHLIASQILLKQEHGPVGDTMMSHIQVYVDHVRGQITPDATVEIEHPVELFYLPGRRGIIDAAILTPRSLSINDLKYGQGVSVDAVDNTQLLIYAESLLRLWEHVLHFADDFPVQMHIIQPRDRNNREPIRTWELTRKELRDRADRLALIAEVAQKGGNFAPSEKACQFCPARGICSAFALKGLKELPDEARIIELPHPGVLSREQRVKVLAAKKVLIKWLEAVEDQEVNDLMRGAEPAGMKLVTGKTNRVWADEDAAQKLLSNHLSMDEMRPREPLISPAAAERLLKQETLSTKFTNRMKSLITKPEGKPTLVPQDDPRPALSFTPNNGLEKLDP